MCKQNDQTKKTSNSKKATRGVSYSKQVSITLNDLKFLAHICKFKSYAKPYLVADKKGGHFATSLNHA